MPGTPETDRPLISVIVPVYNAEWYVGPAVRSVLAVPQDVEVVLVEDGSTDGSLALCRRLAARHGRARLLRHPGGANRGAGASRNAGIRAARGRYVAFLDADDLYLPNRFSVDIPMLERDRALDGVYGAVGTQFDDDHVPLPDGDREMTTLDGPVAPDELFQALLLGTHGAFHTAGITVRREVFERTGLFDPSLRQAQDSAMWLKMAAVLRLAPGSITEPVALWRRHPGNRTRRGASEWRGAAQTYRWSVLRWAHSHGLPERRVTAMRRALALSIVGRREGADLAARAWRMARLSALYGFRHGPLLGDLALLAARKLMRRPRVEPSRRLPAVATPPEDVRLRPDADGPLVSVVIPVYNGERYVAEAVRSVLALPLDVEVVLVEDGSRDGSLAMCRDLAARHPRVRLLRHAGGRNRGAAASRNVGIRAARGRYVAFLDADDLYLPNRLDVAVSMLECDPTVDGVYGAVGTKFDEGHVPMPGGDRLMTTLDGPIEPDELFATLLLGARGSFCMPGITVRRSAFQRSGLFDENLVLTEDSAMWLRLAATGRLTAGSIRKPIALRRRHSANDTSVLHPRWPGAGCDYVWSVLNWARARGLDPIKQAQLRKGMALVMVDRREGARLPGGIDRVLGRILRYGWACPAVLPELLWVFVKKVLGRPLADYRGRAPASGRGGHAR
jgi:glycosyltransferase involved in cell wall biosynthesis